MRGSSALRGPVSGSLFLGNAQPVGGTEATFTVVTGLPGGEGPGLEETLRSMWPHHSAKPPAWVASASLGLASVAGRVLGAPVWDLDYALGEMAAMSEAR